MTTLAIALALLAQTEAAPPGNQQIYHSIILQNAATNQPPGSQGEQLEIESFRWGQATGAGTGSPPAPGSVIVKVEYPWTACQVGARYPSLSLAGGGKRYMVEDVTVSSCGAAADGITFAYTKVNVSDAK